MATTLQETPVKTAPVPPSFPETLPERAGTARTVLAPTLEGLLWNEAFTLGRGLDAIRGLPATESALEHPATANSTVASQDSAVFSPAG